MKRITVALVGQPNVGKSMLINSISNSKLKVGNFPGVTVEKIEVLFTHKNYEINIIDLPGTYALNDYSQEERITKEFLDNQKYDLILNVVDSTNLERNLCLSAEILESNKKVVIALNMIDEAKKESIQIDDKALSSILGVTCIKVSAVTKEGISTLLEECVKTYESGQRASKLTFSKVLEEEIDNVTLLLKEKNYTKKPLRQTSIKLLQGDKNTYNSLQREPLWIDLEPIVRNANNNLYLAYDTKNLGEIFALERASFAKGVHMETVKTKSAKNLKTLTDKVDSILMNKYIGIPIFLFFMWCLFQLTFTVGQIPMDYIENGFSFMSEKTFEYLGEGELSSLIGDGIISGVGAVVVFLPNIIILFLGVSLMEATGYISRVAFLLDGIFHKFGLHGKSFIPLVMGFGCSVPAYMSTRTLKNDSDRLLTLFIIVFMSCSARLPVYILIVGAFFSEHGAGNVLFIIYITGALFGLVAAKFLRLFVFKGKSDPFVMEIPKYRFPSLKLISNMVLSKALMYLKKAGTFILAASILIWFISSYPKHPNIEEEYAQKIELVGEESEEAADLQNDMKKVLLENSYLGMIGKSTEFLFDPLGFDWRMTVALEAGVAAKEVVVATLGILYSFGEEVAEDDEGLIGAIRNAVPLASAISFIVFVMVYMPCLAAVVVFAKEVNSAKYVVFFIVFTLVLAWILAFLAYNITLFVTS